MNADAFDAGDNRNVGDLAVHAACDRWPLSPVGDGDAVPDWYDAELAVDVEATTLDATIATGTPVEVKTCRLWYRDRRGRWWIRRANHEQLLAAGGLYCLSVHDHASGDVCRQALLPARIVDSIVNGNWWAAGEGGRSTDEFRQLPWSTVFDDVGGESADAE